MSIRHKTIWRLAGAALALLAGFALYAGGRSFQAQYAQFRSQRREVLRPTGRTAQELPELVFAAPDGARVEGWYRPSRNGAAVILCHGAFGDRSALLPEADALHAHGFGVLLYDSPGHGESDGEIDWSAREVDALRAALDQLERRPDVREGALGVYGFSMGSIVAALTAASDPRVRALALAAAIPDVRQQVRFEYRRWGAFSQQPALWAAQLGGIDLDAPMPIDVIGKLSPRPVLVIAGDEDPVVPAEMTRALYLAAGEPKSWLSVPKAGHGGYAELAPQAYLGALRSFFEGALGVTP